MLPVNSRVTLLGITPVVAAMPAMESGTSMVPPRWAAAFIFAIQSAPEKVAALVKACACAPSASTTINARFLRVGMLLITRKVLTTEELRYSKEGRSGI